MESKGFKIIFKNELSIEEQIKRVEKFNEAFVDIIAAYHIAQIKNKSNKDSNSGQ